MMKRFLSIILRYVALVAVYMLVSWGVLHCSEHSVSGEC